jgi:tungstate transport system substrate-binding protein
LTLATTTSARDTGLLDVLGPQFKQATGTEIKVIAVGSGQAMELGRRGDADVLLTHSPAAEKQFLDEGFGVGREEVMWNDFFLVGPEADPAAVKGQTSAAEAFARIAKAKAPFVSRGDESGTHVKEKGIWQKAGIKPEGAWYLQSGSGMAETLRLASEKRAYTLADRASFLTLRKRLDLAVALKGDPALENRYSVMLVNPARHPHVQAEAARKFKEFLLSPPVQATIARFKADELGEPIFFTGKPRTD